MNTTEALNAGRALFNAGRHFEAHEVWEDAWRAESGETRQLLQGLILVAAACHKAGLNEPRGTVKLLTSAAAKLDGLETVAPFRGQVMEALGIAERWLSGGPPLVPQLQLPQRF